MIPMPTPEYLFIVAVVAASTMFAVYMAARHDIIAPDDKEIAMVDKITIESARINRDDVLATVAEDNANWMAEALAACQCLPDGEVGTGEDIRMRLLQSGLRAPRHPNVWGALLNTLVKRGMLVGTGEWRPMQSKTSNGRKTAVYAKAAAA